MVQPLRVRATIVGIAACVLLAIAGGCAQLGTIQRGEPVTIVVESWPPSFADELLAIRHQGPLTDVTLWIDPNERFLDDSLRRAFDDIARQMVGVLAGELPYKVRGMHIVPVEGDGAAAGRAHD
jgi:hypothetical protein